MFLGKDGPTGEDEDKGMAFMACLCDLERVGGATRKDQKSRRIRKERERARQADT